MSRLERVGRNRKLALGIGIAVVLGGALAVGTGLGQAATESCQGLDTALQNNLNFIAAQRANPDSQSAARIDNRKAVVDLIQRRRQAAGCTGNVVAQPPAAGAAGASGESCQGLDTALRNNLNFIAAQRANPDSQSAARIDNRKAVVDLIQRRRQAAGCAGDGGAGQPPAAPPAAPPAQPPADVPPIQNPGGNTGDQGGAGVVCKGSTVTLSGEAGAPAASSGQFPVGTKLRVTNLDNKKSINVTVTSTSGSCVLLNNAAFEQVREPGKFLIRRVVIQRLG